MGIIKNKQQQNIMSFKNVILALGFATTTSAVKLQSQDVWYLVEIGDLLDEAAIDIGDWTEGAAIDIGNWTEGAFADLGDWTEGAFADLGDWSEGAFEDTGDWMYETMMQLATKEGQ